MSLLLFTFTTQTGYKRTLTLEDLFGLPSSQKPLLLMRKFTALLQAQEEAGQPKNFLKAATKLTWFWWFVNPFFYKLVYLVAFSLQPLLLQGILQVQYSIYIWSNQKERMRN